MNRKIDVNLVQLVCLVLVVLLVGGIAGAKVYPQLRAVPEGDASIWLNGVPADDDRQRMEAEMRSWSEVAGVIYVSETQRLDRLSEVAGIRLMDGANRNPFPPSFILSLRSPLSSEEIMRRMEASHPAQVGQVNSKT